METTARVSLAAYGPVVRDLALKLRALVLGAIAHALTVGAYKAAKDLQRALPHNQSVVSFDESVFARMLDPALTTAAIPARAIGVQALQLLLAVLEEADVPAQITVPRELVIRASTSAISSR